MRGCFALAIVFGGFTALYACSSPDGSPSSDDGGGVTILPDGAGGTPQQDAGSGGGSPDAAVHGGHRDSGLDDATVGGGGDASGSVKVKWGRGCWEVQNGQRFQAIQFDLTTSNPIPLEATLFFNTKCDNSNGSENFNDVGTTITSGSYAYWFIHHPDQTMTSATWSLADQTTGCIDYQHLPDCR
jgi:hypothetical protein